MTSPETLFDLSGIRARIHTLPERPPFILDADASEIYGTVTRRVNEAVKRNPERFPSDFSFVLTEAEMAQLRSQNATASMSRAPARAFTHIGAYALSGVLKTPIAAKMSVLIHRAFAEQEANAIRDAAAMVNKLRCDVLVKKPIYVRILDGMERGLSIEEMRRETSYPAWKLEQAAHEMRGLGMIPRLPKGMQQDLFREG